MSPIDLEAAAKLLVHQTLLYGHIIAFALALAEVLRADWRMLHSTRLDIEGLEQASRRLKWLLLLLWASGVPLIGFAVDWDYLRLAQEPKLASKAIVVAALTLNGILLHYAVFPMLKGQRGGARLGGVISSVLGAISTASWLYASFVGGARLIAPKMSMADFLGLYAAVLIIAATAALFVVAPRIEKMIRERKRIAALERLSHPSNGEVLVLLRQLEDKILSRDGAPTLRRAHI
jgi:hypothetical protein